MGQPFVSASFPLTGLSVGNVTRFQLRNGEYEHEHAVITLSGQSNFFPDFLTGSPVLVNWGTPDKGETFVGYVVMVKPSVATRPGGAVTQLPSGSSIDVHCLGASFLLKEGRQQVFIGNTADQIAVQVAGDYQLQVFAEANPRIWTTYGQAGLSDWAFLVSLAHDIGYTLYMKNTHLRFHSRTLEIARGASSALVYDFTEGGSTNGLPNDAQIMSFTPTIGNIMGADGTSRARRVLYDLDRRTNTLIQIQDNSGPPTALATLSQPPLFTQYVTDKSADSLQEASQWLNDLGEDTRWYITATAEVQGDVGLLPAHLVYFRNLPSDFSGYWYIKSVTHDIRLAPSQGSSMQPTYTASLELGRDGFGDSIGEPTSLPVRFTNSLSDLGVPQESISTSQLTAQGFWRATNVSTSN